MDIVVGITQYRGSILSTIDDYYDDIFDGAEACDEARRTDAYTIFTILVKVSVVGYMTDIATMATESIYRQMCLRHSVSMLMVSHMVNEIIESDDYRELKFQINRSVTNTSSLHLGVNDVCLNWNMTKAVIRVAKRRGNHESND